jgi:hypothetical protein
LKEKAKAAPPHLADVAAHVDALFGEDAAAELTTSELPETGAPAPQTADTPDDSVAMPSGSARLPTGRSATEAAELAAANAAVWRLLDEGHLDPERPPKDGYQRIAGLQVNPADPDATPMQLKGGGTKLGYQDHSVVDGGKHRVILAALVLPSDIRENLPLADLTHRVCFRWRLRPQRTIADTAYGTGENLRLLEEIGIRAYMPVVDGEKQGPFFKHRDFTCDPKRNVYTCPQGAVLRPWWNNYSKKVRTYRAPTRSCQAFPMKERCTTSPQRWIRRHFDEEYRERARDDQGTAAYKKAMRKRAVWVEPLFGEAKDWHGLRRFRLHGLAKVNIEGLRIAAGQNLKRYLAARGWGRRLGPCGALTAPPIPVGAIARHRN